MAERQVSVEGVTRALGKPFLVLATQNPIEEVETVVAGVDLRTLWGEVREVRAERWVLDWIVERDARHQVHARRSPSAAGPSTPTSVFTLAPWGRSRTLATYQMSR